MSEKLVPELVDGQIKGSDLFIMALENEGAVVEVGVEFEDDGFENTAIGEFLEDDPDIDWSKMVD